MILVFTIISVIMDEGVSNAMCFLLENELVPLERMFFFESQTHKHEIGVI